MQKLLTTLLECSVHMTVISLFYIIMTPFLSKRYSAKWLYHIWLVVLIGWIFPFRPHLNTNSFSFKIHLIIQAKNIEVSEIGWWVKVSIWAACAVGIIVYNIWKHWLFIKMINRWSEDITDIKVVDILDTLRREMKIGTNVGVKTCPCIVSPMMIGFFRPMILLPPIKIDSEELIFILRHELIHLRRKDLLYKSLVLLTTAVYWFNPVVHIMAKFIEEQCEISCDELLVREKSFQQRKKYGETIIGVIRNGNRLKTSLSTNFYRDTNDIKKRIYHIMDTTKKKAGITVLCVTIMVMIGSGITYASNSVNNGNENATMKSQQEVVCPITQKLSH